MIHLDDVRVHCNILCRFLKCLTTMMMNIKFRKPIHSTVNSIKANALNYNLNFNLFKRPPLVSIGCDNNWSSYRFLSSYLNAWIILLCWMGKSHREIVTYRIRQARFSVIDLVCTYVIRVKRTYFIKCVSDIRCKKYANWWISILKCICWYIINRENAPINNLTADEWCKLVAERHGLQKPTTNGC